jgi:diguanylate cyclase (GGDEF)-like protein
VAQSSAIFFSPEGLEIPDVFRAWFEARPLSVTSVRTADELMEITLRGRPAMVVFDARNGGPADAVLEACRRMKLDSYSAIVPAALLSDGSDEALAAAFDAGADEVIRPTMSQREVSTRIAALVRRSHRDTLVHPSTRLPGTVEIETELQRRIRTGESFAVCYVDLDHFKEFNDRYSYYDGDRVIRMMAKILHDVVKGFCGEDGFVGHIGGDDFICIIPAASVTDVCGEIVFVFDLLAPYQYSEQDRRSGYFFGKDRRGQLHRVPLMTVSIGVVTNERRQFTHAAQVSELATEMKSYAKTLPGSVYAVDRRQDAAAEAAAAALPTNALRVGDTK